MGGGAAFYGQPLVHGARGARLQVKATWETRATEKRIRPSKLATARTRARRPAPHMRRAAEDRREYRSKVSYFLGK